MVLDSLSAADRAQLHELYARSVMLLELGRCNQWVELFEPDAVLLCTCVEGEVAVERRFKGRAELAKLGQWIVDGELDVALAKVERGIRTRHLLSNICLFQDGSHHAAGYVHVMVMAVSSGTPHRLASGLYVDRLIKCGSGCWRFANRSLKVDGISGTSLSAAKPRAEARPGFARPSAAQIHDETCPRPRQCLTVRWSSR
jgi:hypothetical protein